MSDDKAAYHLALSHDKPFHLPSNLEGAMSPFDFALGTGTLIPLSPYEASIKRGAPLVFEELAKSDVVKSWRSPDGASALHKIFVNDNATAHHVNVLCKHIDPNITEYPSLDKPIHYAAWAGDRGGMLKALLAHPNIEVNAQTIDGHTAAHSVANAIKSLEQDKTLSVGVAAEIETLAILTMLEKAGADFAIKDNDGKTPIAVLREADMSRMKSMAEFIARHEAQQSKAALLEGLDKPFVATAQEERAPARQRRM